MKKIRLELDELSVESFPTTDFGETLGTVEAQSPLETGYTWYCYGSCDGAGTPCTTDPDCVQYSRTTCFNAECEPT